VYACEELGYRNTLLVAVHGGGRYGVQNHRSEAVLDNAALVEIRGVGAEGNDHRGHYGLGMVLEDGLAHGGVEWRCSATDAGVRTDVNDLNCHARVVDARFQFREEFVGIYARKYAAVEVASLVEGITFTLTGDPRPAMSVVSEIVLRWMAEVNLF
jgi:hypothetical protein